LIALTAGFLYPIKIDMRQTDCKVPQGHLHAFGPEKRATPADKRFNGAKIPADNALLSPAFCRQSTYNRKWSRKDHSPRSAQPQRNPIAEHTARSIPTVGLTVRQMSGGRQIAHTVIAAHQIEQNP